MHKILWDFEIHFEMDHLISARRPDLVIVNKTKTKKRKRKKRTYRIVDFAIPVDCSIKLKENEEERLVH